MSTRNAFTSDSDGGSEGNSIIQDKVETESVTDPTLANGDGTYEVAVSGARSLSDSDVLGVEWSGSQKATLSATSGNTVTVLFESPTGADTYGTEADGALNGTLDVSVVS